MAGRRAAVARVDVRTRVNSQGALARPLTITTDPVPGVNLVGFLDAESGLGEIARRLGRGLQHGGIPFAAIPYVRTPSRQEHPLALPISRDVPYDTNLICLNADHLAGFASDVGANFFASRYSIGVWFWETSVFRPEDRGACRFLDEVWVASDYVRRSVGSESEVPVYVVPVPIEAPPEPARSRAELGLPAGFTFLFLFDFVSAERKNPTAVVEAYTTEFAPGDGAVLVLKSINGRERKPRRLEEVIAVAAERPDIVVLDGYVSTTERDSFVAACDCFVSLHRSEGFGLTMAEAMAHGKPVIATGYSGNLAFMNETNSYLVPYRLTRIPDDWWAYAPGASWAEPDVAVAARLMREVFDNEAEARARGERARNEVLMRFSLDRTASFIVDRLEDARHLREAASPGLEDVRTHLLEASQLLERGIGDRLRQGSGRSPKTFLRRLLLRALWPYLEDQHRFNARMLDALTGLQRSVTTLKQAPGELPAAPPEDSEQGDQPASPTKKRQTSRA